MRIHQACLLIGTLAIVSLASITSASIGLTLEKSFAVPISGEHLRFADFDRDGNCDVAILKRSLDLFERVDSIVIYSPHSNSLLFTLVSPFDSIYIERYIIGDVTRDSVPDLIVVFDLGECTYSQHCFSHNDYRFGLQFDVVIYDGSSNFTEVARYSHFVDRDSTTFLGWFWTGACEVFDFDQDGYSELVYSLGRQNRDSIGYFKSGETFVAQLNPESHILVTNVHVYGTSNSFNRSGGQRWFGNIMQSEWPDSLPVYSHHHSIGQLDESVSMRAIQNSPAYSCNGPIWQATSQVWSTLLWVEENFLDTGYRLLIYDGYTCELRDSMGGPTQYDPRTDLCLYDLSAEGALTLLWRVPTSLNHGIKLDQSYAFTSALPDRLFRLRDSAISIIDATDGQEVGQIPFPRKNTDAYRNWEFPYNDDRLRMVNLTGNEVQIYKLDYANGEGAVTEPEIPSNFKLSPPYPNPFNPTVTVELSLPSRADIDVSVFNILGEKVTRLFHGTAGAGGQKFVWDASGQSSGVYFFRATAGAESKVVKAILLK